MHEKVFIHHHIQLNYFNNVIKGILPYLTTHSSGLLKIRINSEIFYECQFFHHTNKIQHENSTRGQINHIFIIVDVKYNLIK